MTWVAAIAAVERVAARQFGVFTARQAELEGVSQRMLSYQSRPGRRWRRVLPGVYEVLDAPSDWRRPLMAAQLWGGPACVLSHRSAALLLRWDGVRPGMPVDLCSPTCTRAPAIKVHRKAIPEADIVETSGLRHTAALRTLLDVAAVVDDLTFELALEAAVRAGLPIESIVARPGAHGAARIHRVLALRPPDAPATGSELETRFVQLVRPSPVVPTPQRQVPVYLDGVPIAYLDLAWPSLGLFVELDGKGTHDRPSALLYDRDRQNKIVTMLGWGPLRYTWDDVVNRPVTTLRKVEDAIRRAARAG